MSIKLKSTLNNYFRTLSTIEQPRVIAIMYNITLVYSISYYIVGTSIIYTNRCRTRSFRNSLQLYVEQNFNRSGKTQFRKKEDNYNDTLLGSYLRKLTRHGLGENGPFWREIS